MTDTAANNRLLSREAWRKARERMPPILRALSFLRVEVINRIPYLNIAPWHCWVALWRSRVIQDKRWGFFRNRPAVIKWIPGRLLPRRWGFYVLGFEFGERG